MRWFWSRDNKRTKQASAKSGTQDEHFLSLGGRRYVADQPYMLPKDMAEVNRLDFQHFMLRQAIHANYLAPISAPHAILDVGCGTGRWTREVGQQHPQARVLGIDIVLPTDDMHGNEPPPQNVTFMHGNILQPLAFLNESFDFTHQRLLLGAIPAAQWPNVTAELMRVTRRGGWVELVEAAPVPNPGPALAQLHRAMERITSMRGVDPYIGMQIGRFLNGAGLQQVAFHELQLPLGPRAGRMGRLAEANYFALYQSLRNIIIAQHLMDAPTFDGLLAAASDEFANGDFTSPYYVTYGQRV